MTIELLGEMKKNRLCQKEYKNLKISWTRFKQIIASIAFFLLILPVSTRAQNDNYIYSNASLAEKVYLQLDGKVYTTGNIIWFKCIVLSAYNHVPSSLSAFLVFTFSKAFTTTSALFSGSRRLTYRKYSPGFTSYFFNVPFVMVRDCGDLLMFPASPVERLATICDRCGI